MRSTIFALAFVLLVTGCTTGPTTRIPAPAAARDGKTPVALAKSSISQRITEQRIRDAQVAQGKLAVEGQIVR